MEEQRQSGKMLSVGTHRWLTVIAIAVGVIVIIAIALVAFVVIFMLLSGGEPPFIHSNPSIPGR